MKELSIQACVANVIEQAQGVVSLELHRPDNTPLPPFSPGAHIDVHLPNGLIRQYSLYNSDYDGERYKIAVLLEPQGRGGSKAVHDMIRAGDTVEISGPRNHFPLVEADHSILLAGGIGITPIYCMAQALSRKAKSFELHYCCRSASKAAFVNDIKESDLTDFSQFYFDDDQTDPVFDIESILLQSPNNSHLYVCGPKGYMDYVINAATKLGWPKDRIHFEFFSAPGHATTDEGNEFYLQLARSEKHYFVPKSKTALQVLLENGHDIPVSCEQGVCGSCATKVLAGEPEHNDVFLTDSERASNAVFTPCCSRSLSPELVLDL